MQINLQPGDRSQVSKNWQVGLCPVDKAGIL